MVLQAKKREAKNANLHEENYKAIRNLFAQPPGNGIVVRGPRKQKQWGVSKDVKHYMKQLQTSEPSPRTAQRRMQQSTVVDDVGAFMEQLRASGGQPSATNKTIDAVPGSNNNERKLPLGRPPLVNSKSVGFRGDNRINSHVPTN